MSQVTINSTLLETMKKVTGEKDADTSLRKILIDKIRRNLIRHNIVKGELEKKYKMDFFKFKKSNITSNPSFEIEQDYFDWELTITMIKELEQDLKKL